MSDRERTVERIRYDTWPRREAYEFFSRMSDPFYSVTFTQDVTGIYDMAKARGSSFYYSMIWACTTALNDVEAFRVGLRGGELVRFDKRLPSFTDLRPGAEQFHIVTMDRCGGLEEFCAEAAERSSKQRGFIDMSAETDELIYFSCLPWIDLTSLTNERDRSGKGAADDSIPRIAWGRLKLTEDGRRTIGISVEVNHRFIDGVHIGRFARSLEAVTARASPEGPVGHTGEDTGGLGAGESGRGVI